MALPAVTVDLLPAPATTGTPRSTPVAQQPALSNGPAVLLDFRNGQVITAPTLPEPSAPTYMVNRDTGKLELTTKASEPGFALQPHYEADGKTLRCYVMAEKRQAPFHTLNI